MKKAHYLDSSVTYNAPEHIKDQYNRENKYGSACGYVRSNVKTDVKEVTCFYCKKELKRRGLI